jgi:glycosyltransferase involved in cell wall biosynthesis
MLTTTDQKMDSKTETKVIDGIKVIYINIPYENSMSVLRRLFSFVRFMMKSLKIAWNQPNIDLTIATSTPLTVGFPALVLKKLKKIPFVFEVRDLWPEVPIQMGALKNKFVIKVALWFEKHIYDRALHIIALSPGMEEGVLARNIVKEKVSMIPNMSKIDAFYPRPKNMGLMKELGLDKNSFKVVYFGAMGLANAMDYVMEAIEKTGKDKGVEFLFLGQGAMEKVLKERCGELKLTNVKFFGNVAMAKLSEIVNFCDASLVTFSDLPILATNSPNKLFDSLSAGKAIVVNSPGWTKDLVEKQHCGLFVDPKDANDLVQKILDLKERPEIVIEMGKNARQLAETKYDISILCKEFADIIDAQKSHTTESKTVK